MNRIFKRKLVFVKVCSPFSFIRFTKAEKIEKKGRPQEPILSSRFTSPRFTSPRFTSPVQSSPVLEYSMPSRDGKMRAKCSPLSRLREKAQQLTVAAGLRGKK